jgi:nitric-oxide synthase
MSSTVRKRFFPRGDAELSRDAETFIRQFCDENGRSPDERLRAVQEEIALTGTYEHTDEELAYGARVAWRNSSRCIGRLYWRSLRIRDRRAVAGAEQVAEECFDHLAEATGDGKIRPTITVFAPDRPGEPGPRIWNDQLIRYAGYPMPGGGVIGDPVNADLTAAAFDAGWAGGPGGPFDLLPLMIEAAGDKARIFELPRDVVLEVPIEHPDFPWFGELGLRWHAVPVISNMPLEIGGVRYPAAPFNGWYMGTEIGARNLGDAGRYDMLPVVAARLGLDTGDEASLWRDRAVVELNVAVLHSFREAGITVTDHHTESRRFLTHLRREERAGRICPADWSWIVPPISGSVTPVFHRSYEDRELLPGYVRRPCPYDDSLRKSE